MFSSLTKNIFLYQWSLLFSRDSYIRRVQSSSSAMVTSSPLLKLSLGSSLFSFYIFCRPRTIEEWFIQKRRQRSSLLLGGQSCFNSLPRNSYFAPGRVEESAKFAPYSSTRPGSSLEYESIQTVHLLSVQAYCFLSVMNSLTDRNMRKSQQLGERKVGGKKGWGKSHWYRLGKH